MAQEIADSTLLDTWASSGLIVEPDISKIIEGWQLGEQPPHEYMNWLQNTFGSKLNHILKNGVASWNNTTQYLAGSSVQHNGNVWLCKTININSEPTDANVNWKRIITVESLADLSGDYVALTGDQTIEGIKTFSANPVSTATQNTAVNALTRKDYVDTYAMNRVSKDLTTENLNILTNGFYKQNFNIEATLERNYPEFQVAGNLFMYGNGDKFVQIYTTYAGNRTYIRTLDETNWSAWEELVTKTEINTLDAQNVKLSGDQTIVGVKTFSSSPIVPTPAVGDNSTKVATTAFVKAKSELDSIGVGQTYQNASGSRNINQDYTNTSGKPILLIVTILCSGPSAPTITVGGVLMTFTGSTYAGDYMSASVIVPNGAVYRFSSTGGNITSKTVWELR